jgi:cell filamentation protein
LADEPKGSYTYPDTPGDPDTTSVLRNKFGLTRHSELGPADYAMTHIRQSEIAEGRGPSGNFDKEHLKTIHGYIFQDVFEWAGHAQRKRQRVEPIGSLSKGSTSFLHGSCIDFGLDEALRAIRDPTFFPLPPRSNSLSVRAKSSPSSITCIHSARATVAPQEAFIGELGRHCGHEVDFTVISKPRMTLTMISACGSKKGSPASHWRGLPYHAAPAARSGR